MLFFISSVTFLCKGPSLDSIRDFTLVDDIRMHTGHVCEQENWNFLVLILETMTIKSSSAELKLRSKGVSDDSRRTWLRALYSSAHSQHHRHRLMVWKSHKMWFNGVVIDLSAHLESFFFVQICISRALWAETKTALEMNTTSRPISLAYLKVAYKVYFMGWGSIMFSLMGPFCFI